MDDKNLEVKRLYVHGAMQAPFDNKDNALWYLSHYDPKEVYSILEAEKDYIKTEYGQSVEEWLHDRAYYYDFEKYYAIDEVAEKYFQGKLMTGEKTVEQIEEEINKETRISLETYFNSEIRGSSDVYNIFARACGFNEIYYSGREREVLHDFLENRSPEMPEIKMPIDNYGKYKNFEDFLERGSFSFTIDNEHNSLSIDMRSDKNLMKVEEIAKYCIENNNDLGNKEIKKILDRKQNYFEQFLHKQPIREERMTVEEKLEKELQRAKELENEKLEEKAYSEERVYER